MILPDKVEMMRIMLHDVIKRNDGELILKISQELDELIVEFYREYYQV